MEKPPFKIDGHGHLVPYPHEIPQFMKDKEVFWVDEQREFMHQGAWKRPVTHGSFFLDEKLNWLAGNDIDHEVILNLSQLYCNGFERGLAKDVIRFQNDFNASIQHAYPDKFTCGFVVQARYIDDALKEIERCVDELGLQLLCLPTHFLNAKDQWTSIAEPELAPLYEYINEKELAVEIHPYDGEKFIDLQNKLWRFHLIWMCAQTADAYHSFCAYDFPAKYPKMRTCFAHGNQYGQVNVGRRNQGFHGRPDLFEGTVEPESNIRSSNVFFDTLVHDVYSFRLLVDRQTSAQVIAGIDDPYPLGEMESLQGSYPGKVIDDAFALGFINEFEYADIWFDNVVTWLAGNNKEKLINRLQVPK